MRRVKYAIFWGCQIPARHLFTEKATRFSLPEVGLDFIDVDGLTCCPERSLIEAFDEEVWEIAAARNLAVAEQYAEVLFSPCNGCYGTLRIVATKLAGDPFFNRKMNDILARAGLEYQGRIQVRHLVDVLYGDIGTRRISEALKKPLRGLRIAAHPGCHQTRPSLPIGFDDPMDPAKLEELIAALGATPVDHETKMLCCGQYLTGVGDSDDAAYFVRSKLQDLTAINVDAMTTTCPMCFLQYDTTQSLLQRRGEAVHVPVFSYQELLALALGMAPDELGLDGHRTDVTSFFDRWTERDDDFALIEEYIPVEFVVHCAECGACDEICPMNQRRETFRPNEMIRRVAAGEMEAVLEEGEFWRCIDCHTCYEMCPQRFGMEKVFTMLKNISMKLGSQPKGIGRAVHEFLQTGKLIQPSERTRKRLGLGAVPAGGGEDLIKLLDELGKMH